MTTIEEDVQDENVPDGNYSKTISGGLLGLSRLFRTQKYEN